MSVLTTVLNAATALVMAVLGYYAIAIPVFAFLLLVDPATPDKDSNALLKLAGFLWLFLIALPLLKSLVVFVEVTEPVFPQIGEWVDAKMEVDEA